LEEGAPELKIVLGTLKDQGEELSSFLGPRVGGKVELSGGTIEIADDSIREGVGTRDVKTYIKRFLYMKGIRKAYRVFVEGKELTVQEQEREEEEEEEKAAPKEAEKPKEEAKPAKEEAPQAEAEKAEEAEKPEVAKPKRQAKPKKEKKPAPKPKAKKPTKKAKPKEDKKS
jgi:hypothetical protein